MLKNIDIKHIKRTDWYRQGGAGVPYFFYIPFTGGMKWWGLNNAIIQEIGVLHHGYFNKDIELEEASKHIRRQKLNKKYINTLIARWLKWSGKMDRYLASVGVNRFSTLTRGELVKKYKKMCDIDFGLWKIGILIENFDPWADKIIADACKEAGVAIKDADKAMLMAPDEMSFVQKEELDLYDISLKPKVKQDGLLRRHQQKYFWMDNDWAHVKILDVEYFKRRLGQLSNAEKQLIKAKIKNYKNFTKVIHQAQRKVTRGYKIPTDLQNVFYFFSRMTIWRDWRKAAALRYNYYYHLFALEFARRTGVKYEQILFLIPQEIIDSKLNFNNALKTNLVQRSKQSVYYVDKNNRPVVLIGEEYAEFMQILDDVFNRQFKELKGSPASQGKIIGRVKIINIPADFKKMQAGDILVAPMTRPEYMPFLKMAGAIVTDEGGVTCHAAIVSRELGKPCIIGTQVATEVLKDGDVVEVDANKGVIRKI